MASPRTVAPLTTGLSLGLLAAAAGWTVARSSDDLRGIVATIAVAALAMAVVAVALGFTRLLVVAAGTLAAGYLVAQLDRGVATFPVVVFGVLLLVAVEIGADACLAERDVERDAGARQRRAFEVVVVALAGAVGGVVVASAHRWFEQGGAVQFVGGVVAAVGLVLLIITLSRSRVGSAPNRARGDREP